MTTPAATPASDDLVVANAAQTRVSSHPPVLVIAHPWLDLTPVRAALDALNLAGDHRERGSFLDRYVDECPYSAVLIAEQTADLSAKLSLIQSRRLPDDATPCAILVQNDARKDREHLASYAPLIDLVNCPTALVAFLIQRLSLDAAA